MDEENLEAISEELWGCAYPCRFVTTNDMRLQFNLRPETCYCNIPRLSYLFYHVELIVDHYFPRRADAQNLTVTFEYESTVGGVSTRIPLPIYYPLGVLMDMVGWSVHDDHPIDGQSFTIHFRIDQQLISEGSTKIDSAEKDGSRMLRQQQKASCTSMCGCATPVFTFEPQNTEKISESIKTNDFRTFQGTYAKLMETIRKRAVQSSVPPDVYHVIIHKEHKAHRSFSISQSVHKTLGALLRDTVDCFADLTDEQIVNDVPDSKAFGRVLVQGVEPDLCTPIDFLAEAMGTPDFALHITVLQPPTSEKKRSILSKCRDPQSPLFDRK